MSIFQSFQTGLAMGQQQRKERDRDTARKSAADAFKAGNYEMAPTALMEVGDFEAADAYARAGDRATTEQRRKSYGETFKTGGWTGLGEMAAGQGDFETAGYAQGQARAKTLQDWEDHDRQITVQKQGVEFLATSAGQLRSLPLEARGQAAMDIIAQSPFADNPQVMQAVQQAAADGRITDDELTQFEEQMLTYAQKLEGQRWQKSFDRDVFEGDRSFGLQEKEFGLRQTEAARSTEAANAYGLTPVYGRDKDGNRVILQTSKDGTVAQAAIPEGVTLEDDYDRSFNRTLGTEAAKKAAYESQAGQALTAFEAKADELVGQIDTAIEQTKGGMFGNTGFIGQFIAAGDLDGTLDAIGAKAMLSELIAIKNQGGALGALSDSEGKALRDAAVNVARSQSEKQLDANLKAYRLQVERTRMVLKQAFEEQYVNGASAPRGRATGGGQSRPVGPSGQPVPEGFE
jgi:hypothetical protein